MISVHLETSFQALPPKETASRKGNWGQSSRRLREGGGS